MLIIAIGAITPEPRTDVALRRRWQAGGKPKKKNSVCWVLTVTIILVH